MNFTTNNSFKLKDAPIKRLFPFVLASAMVASACGCILTSDKGAASDDEIRPTAATVKKDSAGDSPTKDAHVASLWQDEMLKRLKAESSNTAEAWGLFSEGGWSDNGQVMIFGDVGSKTAAKSAKAVIVLPARKTVSSERPLTPAEWDQLQGILRKANALKDVNEQVFDGLIYQFVHASKGDNGKVQVEKSVYMRMAQEGNEPAHDALIKAFKAIK